MKFKTLTVLSLSSILALSVLTSPVTALSTNESNLPSHFFELKEEAFNPESPLKSPFKITSKFGFRLGPAHNVGKLHNGLDFAAKEGTEVVSIEDGVVTFTGKTQGFGNIVVIDHGNSYVSLYAHLQDNSFYVKEGEAIKKGTAIAKLGKSGMATGPHLHLSLLKKSNAKYNYVDPLKYLK